MALITAAEARTQIPSLTGTGEDTLLDTLIAGCGAAFARRCGYPPASVGASPTMESAAYVLDVDGAGGRDLTLPVWPATAITSIYDDTALDFGATTLVASGDYALLRGSIVRLTSTATHGAWSRGEGCVRISFTAGYATAPADLKRLVAQGVRHWFDMRATQGKENVSQNGHSVTYADGDFLPPWIVTALGAFTLPGAM